MNRSFRRFTASLLIAALSSTALPITAHAETITTSSSIALADRERIALVLDREDVAAQLAAHGISAADAKARVAALTDEEAAQLAGRIDTLPAGGVLPFAVLGYGIAAVIGLIAFAVVGTVALAVTAIRKLSQRESRPSPQTDYHVHGMPETPINASVSDR